MTSNWKCMKEAKCISSFNISFKIERFTVYFCILEFSSVWTFLAFLFSPFHYFKRQNNLCGIISANPSDLDKIFYFIIVGTEINKRTWVRVLDLNFKQLKVWEDCFQMDTTVHQWELRHSRKKLIFHQKLSILSINPNPFCVSLVLKVF